MKKTLSLALSLLALVAMTACTSDEDQTGATIPSDAIYDIVTLTSTSESSSVFTVQKDESSNTATYYCSVSFADNDDFPVGTRMLIAYKMQNDAQAYTSGAITLYGYGKLHHTESSVLTGTYSDYESWNTDAVKLVSMWRTGQYLNVHALMYVTTTANPTKFILVADESTLDQPVIETYLIVKSNTSDGGNQSSIYGSFDIQTLLNISTCDTVRVNYLGISGSAHKDFVTDHTDIHPLE